MTTDNKTLAVDVLAVMLELDDELQSAANYSGEGCYWPVDDDDLLQRSAAARAAVAELIEEHRLLLDALKRLPATDGRVIGLIPLIGRSESALARVKGQIA